MKKLLLIFRMIFISSISILLLATSVWQPASQEEVIRPYTRQFEFDYLSWTINALLNKISITSLAPNQYISFYQGRKIIKDYFQLLKQHEELQNSIDTIFADPEIDSPVKESSTLQKELAENEQKLKLQSVLAEAVIQNQIARTLEDLDLTIIEQPFPPVLYQITELPKELIISPRDIIREDASISLHAEMDLKEVIRLEDAVETHSEYSALVVSVGGVGTYPTMVINTNNLSSLIETVAHEWIHNYLAFRPLGFNYSSSEELRTMNETTASIAGKEISQAVILKFYKDLIKPQNYIYKTYQASYLSNLYEQENGFDFHEEMYITRLKVDDLLAEGKIKEAEDYMEDRRQEFWENGYQIRKLNQAYFAFHGAYADQPYSAAGIDPVGEDVRTLRSRSNSLAEFINKMSWLSTYEDLHLLVSAY